MATKPIFMRPIEITSANDTIEMKPAAGSYSEETINNGVYSCLMTVLAGFKNRSPASSISLVDNGNGEPVVRFTFGASYHVHFPDTDTAALWGAEETYYGPATTITLENRPQFIWVPKYQIANQSRFQPRQKDLFSGQQSKTGLLAGNSTGPTIYYRNLEFHNELASNLMEEGITGDGYQDTGGDMRYMHLDYFAQQSRISQPSVSGNPSTKGFWFWPDIDDVFDNPTIFPGGTSGESTSRHGVKFDLASSPDLFVFCQFDKDGFAPPKSLDTPTGRQYYDSEFTIHTVDDIPTWQYDSGDA